MESRTMLSSVVVNTIGDSTDAPGGNVVSLRDAIATADSSSTPTTITFDPTLFATPQTIVLGGIQLELSNTSQPTTITGPAAGVTVSGNHASRVMYVDSGVVANISGMTLSYGSTSAPHGGGGLYSFGNLTMTDCTISDNVSSNYNAGIGNGGTMVLTDVTISGNQATNGTVTGGLVDDQNAMMTLSNVNIINNTASAGGGAVNNGGTMIMNDVTFSGNKATDGDGGGFINGGTNASTSMTDVTISNNSAVGWGGGLQNSQSGTLALTDSSITDNTATIYNGAIDNLGTATLNRVLIAQNSANTGTSAIGNEGPGNLTMVDDTVTENSSGDRYVIVNDGILTLSDDTISGNERTGDVPAVDSRSDGTLHISNTIIAGNSLSASGADPDVFGTFQSSGFNLIGETDGSTGWVSTDLTGTAANPLNADLGALADNGGLTQTMLPQAGSPAIDAGSNGLIPTGVTTDQRGLFRIYNGIVDVGAVEVQPAATAGLTYLTNFAKNQNIYTTLNEQFPHTGVGIPGSGYGVANSSYIFDPAPSAVATAGYAPDYIGGNDANNGVTFDLTSDASGHDYEQIDGGSTLVVPVGLSGITTVYALMGAYDGQSLNVTFTAADGTTQVFNNVYLPDFNGGSINTTVADLADQTVFQVHDVGGGGTGNSVDGAVNNYEMTEVTFDLTPSIAKQKLTSISFMSNGFEPLLYAVSAANVPTTDSWTGNGDGTNWNDSANWSSNAVPTSVDAVVINAPGTTVNINSSVNILDISTSANLNISGGLTVTSGMSSVSGTLAVSPGSTLSASGSGTTFTATGATNINDSNLTVSGGAVLSLPNATSYTGAQNSISASGAGSQVLLPSVTTLQGDSSFYTYTSIQASGGGEVELPAVTQSGALDFDSSGAGSLIDIPLLKQVSGSFYYTDTGFYVSDGGEINSPDLTTIQAANINVDSTSTMNVGQIVSFTGGGTLTANGIDLNLNSLTTLNNVSLVATAAGILSLPIATSYVGAQNSISASGAGSQVLLPSVTSLQGDSSFYTYTSVQASAGGKVELQTATRAGALDFDSSGTGSLIDIPVLQQVSGSFYYTDTGFYVSNGGAINSPDLTSVQAANIDIDATSTMSTGQIVSFSGGGTITATGTDPDLHSLTTLAGNITVTGAEDLKLNSVAGTVSGSLTASGGAVLSLPNATSYVGAQNSISASGAGSQVLLSSVTSLQGDSSFYTYTSVQANGGGKVELQAATQAGALDFDASGAGSLIDIPVLQQISGSFYYTDTGFYVSNGGAINSPDLTTVQTANIDIDATSTMNTGQIVSFTNGGTITANGTDPDLHSLAIFSSANLTASSNGIISLPGVTSINNSSGTLLAESGGTISLPNVTSYIASGNTTIEATDSSSIVLLPAVINMDGTDNYFTTTVSAQNGGQVQLPAATQAQYALVFQVSGASSLVNIPLLVSFQGLFAHSQTGYSSNSGFYVSGGLINCPDLTTITNANISVTGGTLQFAPSVSFGSSTSISLSPGGAINASSLQLSPGSSLNGTGTLAANVNNSGGVVSPGGSGTAGNLTIAGNYTQAAGGTLQIDIGGTAAGTSYDQLAVTGTATIAGTLQLGLINGYFPTTGSKLIPLTAGSVIGQFTSLNGTALGQNVELDPAYSSTAVSLTANTIHGPYVIATSFTPSLQAGFSFIDFTFNKSLNPQTFVASQIVFNGPGGAITISSISEISANQYQINFATQSMPGRYQISLGTGITDASGDALDQNQSGTANGYSAAATLYQAVIVPQSVSASSSSSQFGASVTLNWIDRNTGNMSAAGGGTDYIYLSTSQGINGSSVLIGTKSLSQQAIAAGGSESLADTVSLPGPLTSLPPGTYYLVIQSSESGATAATSAITIYQPALPNLGASGVSGPAAAVPNQMVTVSWNLLNTGDATATGPWTEQILYSTDAAGDNPTLVQTVTYTGTLAAGGTAARSAMVQLPSTVVGNIWFVIKENPDGQVVESNGGDNTAVAANPTAVSAALTLTLSTGSVTNSAGANAAIATLTRNGSTTSALSVTIANSDPTDVSVPTVVIIPAGRSSVTFEVGTINSGLVRGTASATLTASATGLLSSSAQLTVTDVNVPTLAISVSTTSVDENAANPAATATITINDPSNKPLVVTLVSNTVGKLTLPATVTIPAGQTSVTVPLTVVQDYQIVGDANVTLSATASGFTAGTAVIEVIDTNLPTLSLSLQNSSISQSAGANATIGTVTFSQKTVGPMIIFLASSNTAAATVPAQILVPSGTSSITFEIAAVNNGLDQGDQAVTITAEIITVQGAYLAATKTSTPLTVVNSNGPALTITLPQAAISAGGSELGTVTRNTGTTSPLVVTLSSSNTTHATVPQTVTIPAGQTSATFLITGIDDGLADGEQYSQISATASGLATALVNIGVTTVDLPDLTVSNVSAPASGYAGGSIQVSWTVFNNGMYTASGPWSDEVFLDPVGGTQSTVPLATVTYTGPDLDPGKTYPQTATLTLPSTTGSYTVRIVTDAGNSIEELSFSNNSGTSAQALNIAAPYHATVSTTITTAVPNGTQIPLSGHATYVATGLAAANVSVGIFISVNGTTREQQVTTDSNGNYLTVFQPLQYEAGEYSVAADYPGATNSPAQTQFQIVGLTASPANGGTLSVVPNTPLTGKFTLNNLSSTTLTGLVATVVNAASDLSVRLSVPQTLSGSGQCTLTYSITSSGVNGAESSAFYIQVTTNQGAIIDIPVAVKVVPIRAQLVANPGSLNVGMLVGGQTLVSFQITNTGGAATGAIQINLPSASFLSLATAATVSSLAPGASATVTLLLSPAANLALQQYKGNLAINYTGGSLSMPFTFQAISAAVGNVQVLVDDDYTFFAAGSPHVAGATVTLLNPYNTSQIIASGTTDSTGQITLTNVPAGTYTMQVQAAGHASYESSYTVTPGITNTSEVFLENQLVTYSWVVVPTEIQDQYSIQLQTTFATDVPAPVVTISGPASVPTLQAGQSAQIYFTLTNHGLIAAQQVVLNLPTDPEYTFNALTTNIGTVPAGSSVTVPVVVKYVPLNNSPSGVRPAGSPSLSCTLPVGGKFSFQCGGFSHTVSFVTSISIPGRDCDVPTIESTFASTFAPTVIPTVSGVSFPSLPIVFVPVDCVKCLQAAARVLSGGLSDLIPDNEIGNNVKLLNDQLQQDPEKPSPIKIAATVFQGYETIFKGFKGYKAVTTVFRFAGHFLGGISFAIDAYDILYNCLGISILGIPPNVTPSSTPGNSDPAVAEAEALAGQLAADVKLFTPIIDLYSYVLGSQSWLSTTELDTSAQWVNTFLGDILDTADGSVDAADQAALLTTTLPESVNLSDATELISRWNRTVAYYDKGITTISQVPAGQSTDFMDEATLSTLAQNANQAFVESEADGYSGASEQLQADFQQVITDSANPSICASIQLQINQTATLTRDAFSGTLDISNNQTGALTNMQLVLNITDANGNPANGEFFITSPTFTGSLSAVDGTGILPADASGTVEFTFIPDDSAASTGPTVYNIGGTLSYVDPAGGAVSVNIYPSTITVYPQPELKINYFLQRDVIGEDPSNPGENIPSEPATLGMLVTNDGMGTASGLSLTTAEPEIVDNEKGLLDTFQIIGTQVGTQQISPSLTVDFGDIDPGQTADADFLLTSLLQGIFTNFSATFTHSDALGGLATSLIDSVVTHDLVHAGDFNYAGSTGEMDYLADDNPNFDNLPDTIYFSNGTTAPVGIAINAADSSAGAAGVYTVTAQVTSGWDYIQLPDPGAGYTLYKVVRSDGVAIPVADQAWTTDWTFSPDGKATQDYQLHILDDNSTGSYTVYYKPKAAIAPAISVIQNISSPQSGSIESVEVTFNEAIDASTFTAANISLTLNGGTNLINSGVTITQTSPTVFTISGLTGLTASYGNYLLTINAAGINDGFGDIGSGSVSETWATGTSVPVVVSVGAGNPSLRNTAISSVDVVLSETIVASSFTDQNISLTLNGGSNLIGGGVTITQVNSTTFEIDGLGQLTQTAGNYVLTINAAGLIDAQGNAGVGSLSESWTNDLTAPTILSIGPTPQSPRDVVVPTLDVTFSKPIDPSTLTYSDFSFSKAGGSNLIISSIVITELSATEFEISNFENLVAPIDGTYTFTVNAAGVTDLAGNAGIGTASVSWVLATSGPAAPTNLTITPLTVISSGLDYTGSSTVTLTGSVDEDGTTVEIFEGQTDLGYATVTGTTFSATLTLPSGENDLTVQATDSSGNTSSDGFINIFVDTTPPTAAFSPVTQATPQTPISSVVLTFTKAINPATFTYQALSLTLNGGPNLITSGITIQNMGGDTYMISGLQSLDAATGQYQLSLNAALIKDLDGNAGIGSPSVSWQVALPSLTLSGSAFYLELDSDGQHLDIWKNTNNSGTPAESVLLSGISSIIGNGIASGTILTVDFSNGDPFGNTGFSFEGVAGASNSLNILDANGDDTLVVGSSSVTETAAFGSATLNYSNVTAINFNGGAGSETLRQTAQPGGNAALNFVDMNGGDTLTVNAGNYTFAVAPTGSGVRQLMLGTLSIGAGAQVTLAASNDHPDRSVLVLENLIIAGSIGDWTGTLDLNDNDLIVQSGSLNTIISEIASGHNAGGNSWRGTGLTSSMAANNPTHLTALGILLNNDGEGDPLFGAGAAFGLFDGVNTGLNQILVKYTYYGDANLDGVVDGSDYSKIDSGILNHLGGWSNGDFSYDGKVDGSDYTLIDNAFNSQGQRLNLLTPTITLPVAPVRTYDGTSDVTNWVIATLSGTAGESVPTGMVTYQYFNGTTATGTPLASSPELPGIYSVIASYGGDAYYQPELSNTVTFTIGKAMPMVTLEATVPTILYDGTTDVTNWVKGVVTGITGAALPSGGLTTIYYAGSTATGTPLSSSPINVGTYTVVETYSGDSNYAAASSSPFTFTISANSGAKPLNLTGAAYYLKLDADGEHLDIWNRVTDSGAPNQSILLSTISSITVTGISAGTTLTVDFAAGDPLVASALSFNGLAGANNTLNIVDTGDTNTTNFAVDASDVDVTISSDSVPITYSNVKSINILPGLGTDSLTQNAQPGGGATLAYIGTSASDDLTINAGTFTFAAASPGSGITSVVLGNVAISAGAKLVVAAPDTQADRYVMVLDSLFIASSTNAPAGQVDLTSNDLIIHNGSLTLLSSEIGSGYNNGKWTGFGIVSSAAANDGNHLTAIGIEQNNNGSGQPLFGIGSPLGLFDGQNPAATDILIKFTYYGDANLDGRVDGTDYSRIDSGFLTHSTGWANGDFNYDQVINGSDYTLIDTAFNTRGANLAAETSSPESSILSTVAPVPAFEMQKAKGTVSAKSRILENKSTKPPANFPASVFSPGMAISFSVPPSEQSIENILQSKDLLDDLMIPD